MADRQDYKWSDNGVSPVYDKHVPKAGSRRTGGGFVIPVEVLITGAGGRIGTHLVRALASAGHHVRALELPGHEALRPLASERNVEIFEADITDNEALSDAVAGVDVVCHLAAALTTHDVGDRTFVDSNLNGTFNMLVAVREAAPGLSRFLYVSSDAVYWPGLTRHPLYLPIDEAHPLTAGSIYGATKVGAEAMCHAFWKTYGIPYSIVRPTATANPSELLDPASPFGRRWFLRSAIAWLESHARNPAEDRLIAELQSIDDGTDRLLLLTDADGVASLTMITDARDAAQGMRAIVETPEAVGQAFNIGPEAPHSDRELVEELGRRLDMEVVEIRYEAVRPSWYVSSAKARAVVGYRARRSVFDMIDEAGGRAGG